MPWQKTRGEVGPPWRVAQQGTRTLHRGGAHTTSVAELLTTHPSQLLGNEITHVTNKATPRYLSTYHHELLHHLMFTTS